MDWRFFLVQDPVVHGDIEFHTVNVFPQPPLRDVKIEVSRNNLTFRNIWMITDAGDIRKTINSHHLKNLVFLG